MRSKLCFLMTWFCMWQIKLNFMQCNMVKVIWTFWRMKLELLSHFYCCQGIAKFHIISKSLLGRCTWHTQWSSLICNEQKNISRDTIKPSGWQHTDYRRLILQTTSTIWKAEFRFQTVWFICQSQRWWKPYPLLWKTRHKTIYWRKAY